MGRVGKGIWAVQCDRYCLSICFWCQINNQYLATGLGFRMLPNLLVPLPVKFNIFGTPARQVGDRGFDSPWGQPDLFISLRTVVLSSLPDETWMVKTGSCFILYNPVFPGNIELLYLSAATQYGERPTALVPIISSTLICVNTACRNQSTLAQWHTFCCGCLTDTHMVDAKIQALFVAW